jgi:hypothetical protein
LGSILSVAHSVEGAGSGSRRSESPGKESGAVRVERLNEPVRVRADFAGGVVTPLALRRGTEALRVLRVNARWTDRRGQERLHYFACTVPSGDVYELCLNAHELTWRITSVTLEG